MDKIKTPKRKFIEQRSRAKQRNIEWLFTFETWWKMWEESGKWEQRGNGINQYCMARKGDIGPYSPDNVDIILATQNASDGNIGKVGPWKDKNLSEEHKAKLSEAKLGKKQSEETRKKKSEANKGKPWSEARRAAHNGAWNKGLTGGTNLNYPSERKKRAPDDRGKAISAALKGKSLSDEHKAIMKAQRANQKWVNKDGVCKLLRGDYNLQEFIDQGWKLGRK